MEEPRALDSLFTEKIFRIPDYQRGYAWRKEQLKDFWEDLVNLSGERSHYTGVLTLKQIPSEKIVNTEKEYWLVEYLSYKVYYIVDGQQRLATFIIFLQAFVDFVKKLPENKDKTDDEIFIMGSLSVKELQRKYLFEINPRGDQFRTYKFGYTADNPINDYLRYKIFGEDGPGSVEENFYTLNLSNAKQYFTEQLEELHKQEGLDGLRDIYKKLTKRFLFNEYIIKDEFDVFVAFETMNNRGKKLSDLELLKNRLIYLTTLYDEDVRPDTRKNLRDTINDAWKEVYRQLGRNKVGPLNDDDFLRAHSTMRFGYSRQTGRDYIRFLLNEQFTPKKVHNYFERDVPQDIPAEQYSDTDFEDSEDENADVVTPPTIKVSSDQLTPIAITAYANSLKESAVHWFNSYYPDMAEDMLIKEKQRIASLNRVGMAYFRPLVMAVLKNVTSESERIDIFKDIERFIFVVFRMTATQANYGSNVFYNAAKEIDRHDLKGSSIKEKLKERVSFTFNKDGTLRIDDFYNLLRKKFESGSGYYGWSGLRYFLYEYELSLLHEAKRATKVDWSDLLTTKTDKISIEHIYPHAETCEWAEAFKEVDADKRCYYRATVGNLLLLSAAINSALQNDSFVEKKNVKFNPAGKKMRNGYSDGSHSEIEVSLKKCWGPKQICDRGMKLLSFMQERWGFKFQNDEDKRKVLFLGFGESNGTVEQQERIQQDAAQDVNPATL
jgi:uncharacterized protein with ParB-like and HNH nuclease domain